MRAAETQQVQQHARENVTLLMYQLSFEWLLVLHKRVWQLLRWLCRG
jgi:hypothetical protein